MAAKITIQDIADALGMSRNTVSKAINNTGVVADATKEKILQKAVEMGYKQFAYVASTVQKRGEKKSFALGDKTEIALLTTSFIGNSHFASCMLDRFYQEITQVGYTLTMHRVDRLDLEQLTLPASFNQERTAGIVCVEVFDYRYAKMLCGIGIPTLFADTPVIPIGGPLSADCLYMDNKTHVCSMVNEMVKRGKKSIGFIGPYDHCQSFFERYMGYREAMFLSGLPMEEKYIIIEKGEGCQDLSQRCYKDYLKEQIRKLDHLPDLFICANDFIAFDVMHVFEELGISVPKDTYLCGFDDSPESKLVSPKLTTIHIHSQIMGFSAAQLLLSRIEEPTLNYRMMYTETDFVLRESTEN